ncbi:type II toxin-antitoxin system RatA family toxin [Chromatiaceae bacterium AAb-1]|nr:type II toxin-antitoxin system RatA family toxin [Chromatiaceae bacterium AAb-1]
MPQIERSALVFYSAQQMFELVNDIADYPQFLPGCTSARIISQSEQDMVACLQVSKAGIGHSFTTRNVLYPYQRIVMQLVDGPFKSLEGGWEFQPLNEYACKVILKLEFEFSSKLIQFAFGKVFNELTAAMINAFTQRAKQVYGEPQHG